MSIRFTLRCCVCCLILGMSPDLAPADDDKPEAAAAEKKIPEIADEPQTIDPATLMPEKLAAKVTVDFSNSSLREVLDWLHDKQNLVVLVDKNALLDKGLSLSEPISDRLNDAPLYLLLNRLRALGLAWYFENEILHVTTEKVAEEHFQLQSYNISDLLDAGYDAMSIEDAIAATVAPDSWEDVGGLGVYSTLGDVVFIRQRDGIQSQHEEAFTEVLKHLRQEYTHQHPAQLALRQKLTENVSVNFEDTPLVDAVAKLAADAKVDLRLDKLELREMRIREREPLTLSLTDRTLATILQAMLLDLKLTWVLQDGVLWITSTNKAEELMKTAVYDVRDLCRDHDEANSLADAITSQTNAELWEETGGPGQLNFPQPGTMVLFGQDHLHRDVLGLLETYRTALRASKPREQERVDPQEVVTLYYRMHTNVAQSLFVHLRSLVPSDTWKDEAHPDAPGEISMVESAPDIEGVEGKLALVGTGAAADAARAAVISRAVLIIRQTRENHGKIAEVIRRVRTGDPIERDGVIRGGGGFGGGGFGGAFFSTTHDAAPRNSRKTFDPKK